MAAANSYSLEKRIDDLLHPFRNEFFHKNTDMTDTDKLLYAKHERKALALSQNIAFLVRNHRFKVEKKDRHKMEATRPVCPEDVSIVVRGWEGNAVSSGGGGIAVIVRYPAMMQTVIRTKLQPGDDVIDKLSVRADRALLGIV